MGATNVRLRHRAPVAGACTPVVVVAMNCFTRTIHCIAAGLNPTTGGQYQRGHGSPQAMALRDSVVERSVGSPDPGTVTRAPSPIELVRVRRLSMRRSGA